jgi:hypothetical protein
MANELYIPYANPGWFVEMNPTEVPKYLSKHFNDYLFAMTQPDWVQGKFYQQKWSKADKPKYQFESNHDPINISVINEVGAVRMSISATQVRANKYLPGYFVYEFEVDWSDAALSEGCYFIRIDTPIKTLVSEPISLKTVHRNTILFEYKNSRYHRDVIYETGIEFCFRVEGRIAEYEPGSSDTFYTDQKFNPYLLKSDPYDTFELKIGGALGVPSWVVKIFNEIWSCNSVMIDGKSYAKFSDSKIELNDQENYGKRGISMMIMEGINRGSKVFSGEVNVNKKMVIVLDVQSNLFGELSGGDPEIIPVTSLE